jgi:hypothetical protein
MNQEARHMAMQGFALLGAQRYQEALVLLFRSLQMDPAQSDVLMTLGHLRQLGGQVVEATPFFQAALALDPEHPLAHGKLGRIAAWKGDWAEALAHYRRTVDVGRRPPPPGFLEERIESTDRTVIGAYEWMIRILAQTDDFARMAEVIDEAVARHPDAPEIRHEAFEGWLSAGDLDKAREHLEALLRLRIPPARAGLARRYDLLCRWMEDTLAQAVPEAAGAYRGNGKPPLVIAIAVWGESYVRGFLDHYLRSMAAPGNLPELARHFDIRFAVVTTEESRDRIRAGGAERRLAGTAGFDYFIMPEGMVANLGHADATKFIYRTYVLAQHVAVAYAQAIGAAISFSIPDGIIADGSYGRVGRLATTEGVEGVFVQAPAVAEKGFVAELNRYSPPSDAPLVISPRDLMAMGARNLHPFLEQRVVCPANQDFSESRSLLLWWGPDGLVAHILHWHPIYVSAERLRRYQPFRYVSIDAVLPAFLFPDPADWHRIHLVVDSDEFGFMGTIQDDRRIPTLGKPFSVDDFKTYFRNSEQLRDIGRWMFRYKVRFTGFLPPGIERDQMVYDPAIVEAVTGEPAIAPRREGDG